MKTLKLTHNYDFRGDQNMMTSVFGLVITFVTCVFTVIKSMGGKANNYLHKHMDVYYLGTRD